MNTECMYCVESHERRESLMTFVCELKQSKVYLFKDQTYPGRTVVASKIHHKEMFEMTDEERARFFDDVALVGEVLTGLFKAEKINYSIWGDKQNHVHVHVVPKTQNLPNWGTGFLNTPENPTHIDKETFNQRVELLRKALS